MSSPVSAPRVSLRVLPTLNADGTRRLIRPRLYPGPKWRARRIVAWFLMVTFVALPWLRIGGRPVVLLDVARREFTLLGRTFLPTDGVLLMLLLLAIFMAIVLATALVGRAWCGWACPQTVYMEFLYRPIERLFEGKRERQLELDRKGPNLARFAKNGVFLLVSVLLGNAFLAYFVGTDALVRWMTRSPSEHPAAFLVMASAAALTFFDFAYFREQMCTVICPYARLQSVLLDRRSLVIGYDQARGEPRSKGKAKPGSGDCIDCSACVVACPTGIDIRQGLQLECIACTQCADACDSIMARIKKPPGLIRYAGQESLETGRPSRVLRPRVGVYAGILVALLVALVATANTRGDAEVTILRGIGAPFELREGLAVNQIRVKVRNRADAPRQYRIELLDAGDARLIAPENPLAVAAGEQRSTSLFVMANPSSLPHGTSQREISCERRRGVRSDDALRAARPRRRPRGRERPVTTLGARVWPWVPAGLLGAMLIGLGTMATIATRDPGFALERDYYQKAVNYDRVIAQRGENARLGWSVVTEVTPAGSAANRLLVVRARDERGPIRGARGSVEALRNATAATPLDVSLVERAPGEYEGRLPALRGGLWEFRLTLDRGTERFTTVARHDVAESTP